MPVPSRSVLLVVLLLFIGAAGGLAERAEAILYDLDFGTPPHTVGLPPVTGGGPPPRVTVSSIPFGTPTVEASYSALVDQPLLFDSADGQGDQIELRLSDLPPSNFYRLTTQLAVGAAAPNGTFTFLFDTPSVRNISFNSNGDVSIFVPPSTQTIGTYTFDRIIELRVDIDLVADNWEIYLDNMLAHSGPFGGAALVNSVRVSTNVTPNPPAVRAAIDNLVITETAAPPAGPCNRLEFEDLALGATYPSGSSFVTEGVMVNVRDFFFTPGPCVPPTTSNVARVRADGLACGQGKEIEVNNVSLAFDFGGPVTEVMIPYGEYGGTVDLGINGDCRVVQNFADLSGASLGGVNINVVDFGAPGNSCGVIILTGDVNDLLLGGQELFIDNLSYCSECELPRRSGFEDLPLGAAYGFGDVFMSGQASYSVERFFPPGPACVNPTINGMAEVQNGGNACGAGQELAVNNVNVKIEFGGPLEWIVLAYGEYGGNVNLTINGDCRNVANFADLSGSVIGGVEVWAVDYGMPGQSCGTLYAVGPIDGFMIGGQELFIDRVRACLRGAAAIGDGLGAPGFGAQLEQNIPNPFNPVTTIGFTLDQTGQASLTVYDVAGRAVRKLVDGELAAGRHEARWDGLDEAGLRVPSGVYLYRLEANGAGSTRRMVILK